MREESLSLCGVEISATFRATVGGQPDQGITAFAAKHPGRCVGRRNLHDCAIIATFVCSRVNWLAFFAGGLFAFGKCTQGRLDAISSQTGIQANTGQ